MTRLPILRKAAAALCCAAVLSGCGSDTDLDPGSQLAKQLAQAASARVVGGKAAPAAEPTDLELRAALQEAGQPILQLRVQGTDTTTLLAPVAVNQGITTWISNDRINLSSRDGVLLATRGLGPDLMSASVPSAAQVARGSGSHQRLHVMLDGADQTQKFTFTCQLATVGPDTISVLGLGYATRHITETCTGEAGTATNHYWFQGGRIRKSIQFLVPGAPLLTVEAVID